MERFNPCAQENMYRLEEEPPEMELNDYIVEYKRTNDGYWLACYIHRFERTMFNRWVYKLCDRYNQLSRFKDVKQEMLQAMLEKLNEYDPSVGTTLVQFAARSMVNAVHTYMRKNAGMFVLSDKYYQNLRKVSAIYYRDSELPYDTRIQAVIDETGFSLNRILGYIEQSKWFRYPESIESNISDFVQAKLTPDEFSSPDIIVPHEMFVQACLKLIENLWSRDRQLLYDYLGIVDFERGWMIPENKIRYGDIADKHQLRDEQSVTNRYKQIVAELRMQLEWYGWIYGENTPPLSKPAEKDIVNLTDLDLRIIYYAICKWCESKNTTEFHMLFRDTKVVDNKFVIEFLRLWLY